MAKARDVKDSVGQRLERTREAMGWSLRDAGGRLKGMAQHGNHQTVRNYELDKTPPPADYLAAFARVTGRSLVWLVTGEGPELALDPSEAALRLEEVNGMLEQALQVATTTPADVEGALRSARQGHKPAGAPSRDSGAGSGSSEGAPRKPKSRKAGSG